MRLAAFLTVCAGILLIGGAIAAWPVSPYLTAGMAVAGGALDAFGLMFDDEEKTP